MIALVAAFALAGGHAPSSTPAAEAGLVRDWALSRCVGRAAGGAFRDDAFKSAAALLERSRADIAVFGRVEALVGRYLARSYGGSVPGRYDMLKCLDLYHSAELARLAAGASR